MGFKVVLYSAPALFLAAAALMNGLKTLRATGHLGSIADQSMRFGEFQDFIESRYLGAIGTPPSKL
jgi:hypothetical protein